MKSSVKSFVALTFLLCAFAYAQSGATKKAEPFTDVQLLQPEQFAKMLADSKGKKPVVLQVGFATLYKSNHIPGSEYAGPANRPEGIEALKKALASVPRDSEIVLYCGCCPWDKCPNIRPAFEAAKQMGFTNVKLLVIQQDLEENWIKKGFPVVSVK